MPVCVYVLVSHASQSVCVHHPHHTQCALFNQDYQLVYSVSITFYCYFVYLLYFIATFYIWTMWVFTAGSYLNGWWHS